MVINQLAPYAVVAVIGLVLIVVVIQIARWLG